MDIADYDIRGELGRGGSSRVYLAVHRASGAPLAVKVLSAAAGDACRERFLREAGVAARLRHPNIVRVFDAGASGGTPYLLMDYLPGGDLNARLRAGLSLRQALAVVADVAAALDHAHGQGVVHCDVKPENILFDDRGRAHLADFGIAAIGGASAVGGASAEGGAPADAGAAPSLPVRGTRPYMSPERLEAGAADGTADFYALGVVFHRMLTGRLPSGGPGVPALPLQFAAFQEPMRRLLAPSPQDRFGSGAEIVAALAAADAAGAVPDAALRAEPVATEEIEAVAGAWQAQDGGEPSALARRRLGVVPTALLGALLAVVGAGGAFVASPPGTAARVLAFAGLAEHPDIASAWQEAEALRLDPNQSLGAVVAAYRRILARDAAHAGAAAAIDAVAGQWQRDVGAALDAGDTALASAKLDELAELFPGDAALPDLFDRLRDRRQAERMLADTMSLLGRAGLSDAAVADVAIVRYEDVLRRLPGNGEALAELNEIAEYYGDLADRQAAAGDLALAMDSFDRAVDANREFAGVEAVRATLDEAEEMQARIDAMLEQAADYRANGALIVPASANAAEIYREVLAIRPDDAVAAQGLQGVADEVLSNFIALLEADRLEEARDLRDRAAASGIGDDTVAEMSNRYEDEEDRIAAVKVLIARAEALYEDGYIIKGPNREDNAVARLREALRLDADNADVARLLFTSATRLAEVAEEAYDAGMVEEGLRYLDLALTVTPDISRWSDRRERWRAERWRRRAASNDSAEAPAGGADAPAGGADAPAGG